MPTIVNPTVEDLGRVLLQGQGLLAEAWDRGGAINTGATNSGDLHLAAAALPASTVVTNLHIVVTGAASASTLAKLAIYSKTGSLLAQTANLTTAWETAGLKTHPLAASYVVPASDLYYLALLFVGLTGPTMPRASQVTQMAVQVGTGARRYAQAAGAQTDMPSSATVGDGAVLFWVGAS